MAFEICSTLVNEILEQKGVAERYSPEDLIYEFVGLNFRRIMLMLQQKLGFDLYEDELAAIMKEQENRVIVGIRAKTKPCPGVVETIAKLRESGHYTMAVASSSSLCRIRACLEKAGLIQFFDEDKIFSAADSLATPASKPNPAVYFHALEQLGARAEECLTVEDSMAGLRAAQGAEIPCLGYVGSTFTSGTKDEMAGHLMLNGCKSVMWDWLDYTKHLTKIEGCE